MAMLTFMLSRPMTYAARLGRGRVVAPTGRRPWEVLSPPIAIIYSSTNLAGKALRPIVPEYWHELSRSPCHIVVPQQPQ